MDNIEKKIKIKSKEYPASTLKQAITFIEKLKDFPTNKLISYDVAAKTIGVKATTKSFTYTISAAKQFGLITTSEGKALSLTDKARRLTRPTETTEVLQKLRIECFASPKLYSELIDEYHGKSLPEQSIFENVLITVYGIAPNAASKAVSTFIESANEVGVIQNGILDTSIDTDDNSSKDNEKIGSESQNQSPGANETPNVSGEFSAPLTIPFGDTRKAVLYMPIDIKKEDAKYVLDMISLMFTRVYNI